MKRRIPKPGDVLVDKYTHERLIRVIAFNGKGAYSDVILKYAFKDCRTNPEWLSGNRSILSYNTSYPTNWPFKDEVDAQPAG